MIVFDLYPRKCHNCGKKFEAGSQYVYKIPKKGRSNKHKNGNIWFCSYHCIREYEKAQKRLHPIAL